MAVSGYLSATVGFIAMLSCATSALGISVMSVDLGSYSMKVAIVSPGVPMEIALNKESKRGTPAVIAFRDGVRTFGEDAESVAVRFPELSYGFLLDLLGKRVDNPVVKLYTKRFPYYRIIPDPERGTVLFQHDSKTAHSPEELVAQLLHRAQQFAQDSAGQVVREAVLTVPGYFGQAERKSMLQAAELAGLKVLQLINDYMAVALNYGIFRRKEFNETAQYIMFYDMGASSTTASLVSYQLVKTRDRGVVETNPHISVLGVGYDRLLGGLEMTLRLRDYLATKFNELKKTPNDVFHSPRALSKLLKEAGRLKTILSANAEHYAQVEGLLDDIDFKLKVTREQFEGLCTDLFERVKSPIELALKSAGLTIDVVNQLVLVGAGTRVPAVQDQLAQAAKKVLSKNLNTDEAAVMGAVYKAADLSQGFKVKKFVLKDAVIHPVQVLFEREAEGNLRQVKRTLFGLMNPYPQKKIITFHKHQDDFAFSVSYADLDHLTTGEIEALGPLNLSRVELTGVRTALDKHSGPNAESKGIKAHFTLDENGLLSLASVELFVEKSTTEEEMAAEQSPLSKLGSTISKLFTGPEETLKENLEEKPVHEEMNNSGEEIKEAESGKKEEGEKGTEGIKDEAGGGEDNKNVTGGGSSKDGEKSKVKVVVVREPIAASETLATVQAMGETQFQEAAAKIEALNRYDMERSRREGALNALESFVFDARNKLQTEEYTSAATQQETDTIQQLCSKMGDWLEEEGWSADVDAYETRLAELRAATREVWVRVKEHRERPSALAALAQTLNSSRSFLATVRNISAQATDDEPSVFTPIEVDTLEARIKETEEWRDKSLKEQNTLPLYEAPKLTVKLLVEKMALLDREVKYLVNKAKLWRPKVKEVKEAAVNETVGKNETTKEKAEERTADEQTIVLEEAKEDKDATSVEDIETMALPSSESTPEPTSKDDIKTETKEETHEEL